MTSQTSRDNAGNPTAPFPPPAVGWYATITLAFLYWMSVLDRYIIALMVDPIKADLGITDTQLGILQGLAFMVSFTIFGFVFGALADRKDRRRLIYIGVTIWSFASAACGTAQNFWHFLFARAGLGAGEASLNPSATSMISDLFPREKLTSAMAVYSIGASVGGGTAFMVGGAVIYYVSSLGDIVLPGIGQIATWQAVFFIVGLSSLPFAFLVFTFPEPVRRGRKEESTRKSSWRDIYAEYFRFMASHAKFFTCHYLGFTLSALVVVGCVAWYPVHMIRHFGWNEGQVGFYLGMILLLGGIFGKLACGWLVDAMYRKGHRDGQLRWFAFSLLIAAPTGVVATTSGNPWVFLVLIGLFGILTTTMHACAITALNLVTPNQFRGTGVAVFTTLVGLAGGSLGMVLVPGVSDFVYGSEAAIGLAMATVIGVVCPIAALVLALGCKPMRLAMEEIERL